MKSRFLAALLVLLLAPAVALAQSSPGFVTGQVPSAAQWNAAFSAKQDYSPITPTCAWSPCQAAVTTFPSSVLVTNPSGTISFQTALPSGMTIPNPNLTGTVNIGSLVLSSPLNPSFGGSGAASFAGHSVLLGEGSLAFGTAAVGTAGRVLVDQGGSADPAFQAISGDGFLLSTGALTVNKTGGVAFAASATTDTTNAANIGSGTLPAGRLPAFSGDLSSSLGSAAPLVVGLQGHPVSSSAPASTNVLAWNGTAWAPAASSGGTGTVGSGTTGQIPGYASAGTAVSGVTVSGDGTLNGATGALVVTKTNGVAFAASATTDTTNASNIASGTLSGALLPTLSGDVSNSGATLTVIGLQGRSVAATAPASTNVLAWNGAAWAPAAATGGTGTVGSGTTNQIAGYASTGTAVAGITVNGDGTLNGSTGALVVTKTNGAPFVASATTDTTNATNISSGTIAVARLPASLNPASVAITGGSITGATVTGLPTPSATSDAATKLYVDAAAHQTVAAATTTILPTNTYSNGSSGVGSTLTATANGALTIDGYSVQSNDRLLIQNEATSSHNGVYTVSATGSAGAPYILTRALDFNQVANILPFSRFTVVNGTVNGGLTFYLSTTSLITVGTTNLAFAASSTAISAGTPDIVIGSGTSPGSQTVGTTNPINSQSGSSYAVQSTDARREVNMSNTSGATAVTIAQAGTSGFSSGFATTVCALSQPTTITPSVSSINNNASLQLAPYQCAELRSNGTQYLAAISHVVGAGPAVANLTALRAACTGYSGCPAGDPVYPNGVWRITDGAAGASPLWFNTGSGACATDDGASCVNSADSNHWNPSPPSRGLDLSQFGASTAASDNSTALQAWANSACSFALTAPPGIFKFATAPITFPSTCSSQSISGSGVYGTTLEYTGTNTTNDLVIMGRSGGPCLTGLHVSGLNISSSTMMTGGTGLHLEETCASFFEQDNVGGQYNTAGYQNLWNGIWCDFCFDTYYNNFEASAVNDVIRASGQVGHPMAGFYYSNCKVSGGAIGVHIGGAAGAVDSTNCDIIANGTNVVVDHAIVAAGNLSNIFDSATAIDTSSTGPGVLINDSLFLTKQMMIFNGTWDCTNATHGLYVQNINGAKVFANFGAVCNNQDDGIRVDDASAYISDNHGPGIYENGQSGTGFGVNATVANSTIYVNGIPPANASGPWDANALLGTVNCNLGTNCYTKDFAGNIHQWGVVNFIGASGTLLTSTWTYPVPFPNAAFIHSLKCDSYGWSNGTTAQMTTGAAVAPTTSSASVGLVSSTTVTASQPVQCDIWGD